MIKLVTILVAATIMAGCGGARDRLISVVCVANNPTDKIAPVQLNFYERGKYRKVHVLLPNKTSQMWSRYDLEIKAPSYVKIVCRVGKL